MTVTMLESAQEIRARRARERDAEFRRRQMDDAIDRFQSAIIESAALLQPNAGASCRIGRARTALMAAIEARDRAERNTC
jgi:hypothetical protein